MRDFRTPVGYVGVTDEGWYRFLRAMPNVDEVNFWRPKDPKAFAAVPPGSPFFFKLKAPYNAIVGFAFFARFAKLPLSLVWETFREKNGIAGICEMRDRIARVRRRPIEPGEDTDAREGDLRVAARGRGMTRTSVGTCILSRRERSIPPVVS